MKVKPRIFRKFSKLFFKTFKARGDLPNIKPGELSWSFVSETTGKKIIADCGIS